MQCHSTINTMPYLDLNSARHALRSMGYQIETQGLPEMSKGEASLSDPWDKSKVGTKSKSLQSAAISNVNSNSSVAGFSSWKGGAPVPSPSPAPSACIVFAFTGTGTVYHI